MRLPRRALPPPRPHPPLLHLLVLLSFAVPETAAAPPRTSSIVGMAWPTKCTWLPLPTSGMSHSYTLFSKYHKIWKETKEAVSANDVSRQETISGVIALKGSMKYFDADFFNDSKLREMEDGAIEFNVPAFRDNRKLVALENGGLHNPSALVFKSSWNGESKISKRKSLDYPITSSVHRPSKDEDIAFMSIMELGELIRTKQVTSRELTDVFLRRLKRYSPVIKSVITVTDDLAYKQAKEADDLLEQGKYLGLLHGIPYGLKDIIAVPEYKTTWGSKTFENQVLDIEAYVYKRLKSTGAVLVAKLVTGSLAYDDIWFGGRTRNPWNIEEFSTGSSAGPAASTSAGMVPFAIGSETAGSITYPAARCGVTALRPTFGTVARTGVMSISESLDKLGPFCRSAIDCAVVLDEIRGKDAGDPSSREVDIEDPFHVDITQLTVGYLDSAEMEVIESLFVCISLVTYCSFLI
ncbi:hypothetical protein GUJ93_ZPchr0011g28365 [Zizania palustris]|uniref:Amidase domain-containing protein n=1 Tax=Zizania palustris TaxID=103762 RepID=A0A8J5WKA7_ZIZPA|nr:hypothetical protein GUJ93_ZPchr0011g28365 [Zizania palustris]